MDKKIKIMAREYDQEKAMENLEYKPEWCEKCYKQCEKEVIKYKFNWYEENGIPYCSHCGRIL
jgi:DNA modification methylase